MSDVTYRLPGAHSTIEVQTALSAYTHSAE